MKRLALVIALPFVLGCASSEPRIARVQTSLANPAQVIVYVQRAGSEVSLRLGAAEGVEVVEAKLSDGALKVRWKRSGLCPMSEHELALDQLPAHYALGADGTCALAD